MSPDDHDPPVHRISRVEDRERLLAEALAHSESQDTQYRALILDEPPPGRWKAPVALALFAVAGLLAAFPPGWLVGAAPPTVADGDLERGLRAAMYLQAQQVEVFRLREGRLPAGLDELPVRLADLRLVRSNNRVYQILGRRPGGRMLVYDSAHPAPGFEAAAAGWLAEPAP